ncbi:MAG: subclass B1 metallo-beta-lactamase [Bacteroidia bacterium]|nr:subclass B1 metallo-beta-lactamase [Bacteroidia bacterium]
MKYTLLPALLLSFLLWSCQKPRPLPSDYQSAQLQIKQLNENAWLHTSFLKIPGYGDFPCNGLVYFNGGEALILDTPTNDSASHELLDWVEMELQCKVKGVVVNHFHEDCLGGLKAFHQRGIPSYANQMTLELAASDSVEVPQRGFSGELILEVGKAKVHNRYFGPGHAPDNLVSYMPEGEILFGGCMIKEVGAGKGNLSHANLAEWSPTVEKVRLAYPNLQLVVPGHGKPDGTELLDYTRDMFAPRAQ